VRWCGMFCSSAAARVASGINQTGAGEDVT
jgi:hypothetical protein